jgi:uncharacterized protein YeeX (DUF496 family)
MKIFNTKILLVGAVVFLIVILSALAQEMNRRIQVQREVARLEQEVRDMDKSILEMENLNQYFRSDAYQERMAREKLNYREEGETVVLLPDEHSQVNTREEEEEEREKVFIPLSWWRTFFD